MIARVSTVSASIASGGSVSDGHMLELRTSRSLTITDGIAVMKKLKPVTPGELLAKEFLQPMKITQYRLAKELGIPAQRIGDIVLGKRAVSADTDLRLCRFFGLSNGYWLRAQAAYDTEVAERSLSRVLTSIKPWAAAVAEPKAERDASTRGTALAGQVQRHRSRAR